MTVENTPPTHRPAQDAPVPAWRSLYPFASQWLSLGPHRLHYLDESRGNENRVDGGRVDENSECHDHSNSGSAEIGPELGKIEIGNTAPSNLLSPKETLLFVHGNPTWSFHWRRMISAWRDRWRCVAPDHLGSGLSDKPADWSYRLADHIDNLQQLIESLDLKNITLVAQDWGGAIGLGAALKSPERFSRFVLFNTGAFRPWFIPWKIRACRIPLLGRLALQGGNLFSLAALRMTMVHREQLSQAECEGYLAPYHSWADRIGVTRFVQDIPATPRHPTYQTLAEIEDRLPSLANRPFQFIWGMQDWCFTPACLDKFTTLLPKAQVCRLSDAGHWVVEDAPGVSQQQIEQFIRSTEGIAPRPS